MNNIAVAATGIVNALFRSIDARDAAAVAELLTDDAAMADEMSRGWVRGKAHIQEFVGTTFAEVESITSAVSDVVIRESADHATVTLMLTQSYVRDGQPGSIVAPTSLTLERGGGDWLISVMQSSPHADG
jgi:ketosteroid isomerase-like protein